MTDSKSDATRRTRVAAGAASPARARKIASGKDVARTVDQFAEDNLAAEQARDWLVSKYPELIDDGHDDDDDDSKKRARPRRRRLTPVSISRLSATLCRLVEHHQGARLDAFARHELAWARGIAEAGVRHKACTTVRTRVIALEQQRFIGPHLG